MRITVPLFRRIKNEPFRKLLIKNMALVLAAILLPLLLACVSVYSYSHWSLLEQTDAANARTLENTRTTMDMILRESESRLMSFATNTKVKEFLRASKQGHPNYPYIERANEIMHDMNASRRPYLDSALILYSELGNFTLSTLQGGQSFSYYDDQELCRVYRELKDQSPEEDIFYVLRNFSYTATGKARKWRISIYRTIPVAGSPLYSFVCMDISVDMLTGYLTDNTSSEKGTILLTDENGQILLDSTAALQGEPIAAVLTAPELLRDFQSGGPGAGTLKAGEMAQRVSWVPSEYNGWRCMQLIPLRDYMRGLNRLRNMLMWIIAAGVLVSIIIAYFVSLRLFSPVRSILRIVEDPKAYDGESDRSGEIQYLLMNVLDSFQKNITLEGEMVEKMALLRNARAKALQEQMTPHFLYNALQAINWLAVSETGQEDSKTSRTIITLSEMARTCMEQSDNFCTVREELAYVRRYMEIVQLRFGEDVCCYYDVQKEALDDRILRISLQPLVENAVSHGIQQKDCRGHIYIQIRCEESVLHVMVEDDGVGVTDEQLAALSERCRTEYVYANQHVGLVNLSQRIKLVYGEDYEAAVGHSRYGGLKVEFAVPKVKIKRLPEESEQS